MSYCTPLRDRSPERTPPRTPESPGANAKTRETIAWLMQVQYHGGMASPESAAILRALAHSLPAEANALNPDLLSVVASIQAFASTSIYDPHLADKATIAIDSLAAKLSSPVKVDSPSRKAPASVLPMVSKAARKLNFDEFE